MRKQITPKKVVMKEIRNKNDIRKQIEKWQNFHICNYNTLSASGLKGRGWQKKIF